MIIKIDIPKVILRPRGIILSYLDRKIYIRFIKEGGKSFCFRVRQNLKITNDIF